MTEDEMKETWCPHVRMVGDGFEGAINRWKTDEDGATNPFGDHNGCIGSKCSQWRWQQEKNQPALLDWAKGDMNDPAPDQFRTSATLGFCGLAGKL